MLCKQCGAQIRKEHKKADGIYQCPDCGKMYRLKSSSAAGGKAPAGKKAKRGVDKRLLIGGVALLLVLAILLVILAIVLVVEGVKALSAQKKVQQV